MKKVIVSACIKFLKPLAFILLTVGVSWKEFSEISKRVFVHVASENFGIRGRKTNASRISIMTGLNRKEVQKIRAKSLDEEDEGLYFGNRAGRLLSSWHADPNFLSADGEALELPLDGESPNFNDLCRKYGGDISAQALLKELLNTQSVVKTKNNRVKAVRRFLLLEENDRKRFIRFCSVISDFIENEKHNFLHGSKTRLEGQVSEKNMPITIREDFHKFLESKGDKFFEDIDEWLSKHRISDEDVNEKTETIRLGAGVYTIVDEVVHEKKEY